MIENYRHNIPCFAFDFSGTSLDNLMNATLNLGTNLKPIMRGHKDLDVDLQEIKKSIEDALMQNNLYIKQQVIYNCSSYELGTILQHSLSGEHYELRTPISTNRSNSEEFELAVKYHQIESYIDILGLPIIDAELYSARGIYSLPLQHSLDTATRLSYSDIKLFLDCARCFYLNKKFKVKNGNYEEDRFTLSNANDETLKDEFNKCRRSGTRHPLMIRNNVDAIPFNHQKFHSWQNSDYGRGGIKAYDQDRNCIISGTVDDLWQNSQGKLIVVDYKTTAKDFKSMDDEMGILFRRQLSLYAWLLQKNGCPISDFGFVVLNKVIAPKYSYEDVLFDRYPKDKYVFNPRAKESEYQSVIKFESKLLTVALDFGWIEEILTVITECLSKEEPPKINYYNIGKQCFNCATYQQQKGIEDWYNK